MNKVALDAAVVTILNAASQLCNFLLFVTIAALFGADWHTDAFFLALTVIALFIEPVNNAIAAVFIPVLTEFRIRYPASLGQLAGKLLLYVFVATTAGVVVVALAAPAVLKTMTAALSADSQRLALEQIMLLLPMMILQTTLGVLTATFNSLGRFWLPAGAVTMRYLATLGLIVLLRPILAISALPISFVLGSLFQFFLMAAFWGKLQVRLEFGWRIEPELVRTFRLTLPVILGMAILQLVITVSRFLAAWLPAGSVSVLDYASRISRGIMELLTSGVLLVTLVNWSHVVALGDTLALRARLRQTILMMLFVVLPIVSVLVALHESVIAVTLQRGQFDAGLATWTSSVLVFFLLGIPLDVILRSYVRLFLVWQDTWIFGGLTLFRLSVMLVCALVLMQIMGAPGLALADTLGIGLMMGGLVIAANRKLGNTLNGLWWPLGKLGIASLACGTAATVLARLMSGLSAWVKLPVAALLGCLIYILIAWALRVQELTTLVRLLIGRGPKESIA